MKDDKRFEIIDSEADLLKGITVLCDKETGVQYLFYKDGYAGGLTPLLDKDGKPVIDRIN